MRVSRRSISCACWVALAAAACTLTPVVAAAQSAGDATILGAGSDGAPAPAPAAIRSAEEIEALVAPVALYPDDLLAIVLPASTFPLQVVQAARFLEAAREDSTLEPDEDWDDSVVALLNYPEVLDKLSDDLDWTWELGQAVLAQQEDVVAAVAGFRDRAHAAGNLKSDERQTVEVADSTIRIKPANPEVIYVPYYEPSRVVVYQRAPVYYYYPRAYPVYYYPYPVDYPFYSGFFWGVTTYYSLGWHTRHVHIHPYDHRWHPYYSRWSHYDFGHYYYRRPRTVVYNHYHFPSNAGRHHAGNAWKPHDRRAYNRPGRPHYYAERNRHDDGRRYRDGNRYRDGDRYTDADRYRDGGRHGDSNRYRTDDGRRDDGRYRSGERRWAGTNVDGDHRRDRARQADRRDHAGLNSPIEGRARMRQPDQARPDGQPRKAAPTYRMPEQRSGDGRVVRAERAAGAERAPRGEPSQRAHVIRQQPENRGRWAANAGTEQRTMQAPRPQLRTISPERAPVAAARESQRAERSAPRGQAIREQARGHSDQSSARRQGDRAGFTPR
ncbi:MAG: DUF3300 domain-containing protein [bacterium]